MWLKIATKFKAQDPVKQHKNTKTNEWKKCCKYCMIRKVRKIIHLYKLLNSDYAFLA